MVMSTDLRARIVTVVIYQSCMVMSTALRARIVTVVISQSCMVMSTLARARIVNVVISQSCMVMSTALRARIVNVVISQSCMVISAVLMQGHIKRRIDNLLVYLLCIVPGMVAQQLSPPTNGSTNSSSCRAPQRLARSKDYAYKGLLYANLSTDQCG